VTLNKDSTIVATGAAETLYARVQPSSATNQNVTWSSSANDIASVSAAGGGTGAAIGNATITARAADGGHTATCAVQVAAPAPIAGVTLSRAQTITAVGRTDTLAATVEPPNAYNKSVTWSSSRPEVASVSATGVVTGVGEGAATITATTADAAIQARCDVTVRATMAFVKGGSGHGLFIRHTGTLWGMGLNTTGQVGTGDTVSPVLNPTRLGLAEDSWTFVDAHYLHTAAIKSDGSLWGWGQNTAGQVGNNTTTNVTTGPVRIGADNDWTAVDMGDNFTVALKADGTLWNWGSRTYGQLGDGNGGNGGGNRLVPAQMGTDAWKCVTAGYMHTVAIKADGSLWAWGRNAYGQVGNGSTTDENAPRLISSDNDWVMVAAGDYHNVALKEDGSLWAWGYNSNGQVGNGYYGTTGDALARTPVRIGSDTDWSIVGAGANHTFGVKRDGSLWGWGANGYGQIGDGGPTSGTAPAAYRLRPTRVGTDNDWVYATGGGNGSASYGVRGNGELWGWGYNSYGNLGNGATTNVTTGPIFILSLSDE
jgi:alpha-tubulin suppressor-like RCC1 family protein